MELKLAPLLQVLIAFYGLPPGAWFFRLTHKCKMARVMSTLNLPTFNFSINPLQAGAAYQYPLKMPENL